jgi:hypothetical protein
MGDSAQPRSRPMYVASPQPAMRATTLASQTTASTAVVVQRKPLFNGPATAGCPILRARKKSYKPTRSGCTRKKVYSSMGT